MISRHILPNGLILITQPMPWLRTAAYTLWLPGGIAVETNGATVDVDESVDPSAGLATLTVEMIQRGAGNYSSRELVAAEDNLGIDGSASASLNVAGFSAAMPADSLVPALGLLADVVRRPHLPSDQFEDAKSMLRQEMLAVLDEPTQRLMKRLRQRQYGSRLGRSGLANEISLESLSTDQVREFYLNHYHAGGSVLAIAGNFDPTAIQDAVNAAFGDWQSGSWPPLPDPKPIAGYEHITQPSSQTHIGFAFDSVPYGHEDYFVMRAGIGILSDGMSSRLFDRVREQRGLCYSVYASSHSLPNVGSVFGYAGTTPPRAQETFDVTIQEIQNLGDDLQRDELERWKTRIQSSLIMEQESAGSRSTSLASDQLQIGEVIPAEQLEAMIEEITLDQVTEYWKKHRPEHFRVVTIGPEPLQVSGS